MIVVAGHLQLDPDSRASYLKGLSRGGPPGASRNGMLGLRTFGDLLDPGRINVFERWETMADVEAFRGSGPSDDQTAQIREADVRQFEVVSTETL